MLVLERYFGIVLKNMIIDIFEGVRLHFLHFYNIFGENRNSHVLVLNLGVFLGKDENEVFYHFRQQFWHFRTL